MSSESSMETGADPLARAEKEIMMRKRLKPPKISAPAGRKRVLDK